MSDIYQAGANWLKNGVSSQAIEAVPNKFANSGLESFFKERAPDVADMMNIAGASINDLHTMGTQVFHKIENEGVSALVQLGNDPAFYDLERQMKVFMTPEKAENLKNLENNFFSVLSNDDCSPIKDYAETMNFLMTAFLVGAPVSLTAFFVGPWLIKKASKCRMPSCFKRTPPPIANNIPPVSRQQFLINRSADKPRRSQPQELPLGQRNNPIDHEQEKVRRQSLENEWAKRQRAVINGKVN